ncbi:unnamed protein product [Merluccius merluccius]
MNRSPDHLLKWTQRFAVRHSHRTAPLSARRVRGGKGLDVPGVSEVGPLAAMVRYCRRVKPSLSHLASTACDLLELQQDGSTKPAQDST